MFKTLGIIAVIFVSGFGFGSTTFEVEGRKITVWSFGWSHISYESEWDYGEDEEETEEYRTLKNVEILTPYL